MGKGSSRRPTDHDKFSESYDKIFKQESKMYIIETKDEVFYSERKLDVTFKHVEFLYRDNVRYKELTPEQFDKLKMRNKKKFIKLEGSV